MNHLLSHYHALHHFPAAYATGHKIKLENVLKLCEDKSADFEYFVMNLVPTITFKKKWGKECNIMARHLFQKGCH